MLQTSFLKFTLEYTIIYIISFNKWIRGSVICFVKIEHQFCICVMKLRNRQKPELVIDIVSIVDYLYVL